MKGEAMITGLIKKALEAAGCPNRDFKLVKKRGHFYILLDGIPPDAKGNKRGPYGRTPAVALLNLIGVLNKEMIKKAEQVATEKSAPPPPTILKRGTFPEATFKP